jgi:hypothetical protein
LRGSSNEKGKLSLAFIPTTEYEAQNGGDHKPKIKVPKVSGLNLKVLNNKPLTSFPATTYQTEDGIEKGESSQFITGCFE